MIRRFCSQTILLLFALLAALLFSCASPSASLFPEGSSPDSSKASSEESFSAGSSPLSSFPETSPSSGQTDESSLEPTEPETEEFSILWNGRPLSDDPTGLPSVLSEPRTVLAFRNTTTKDRTVCLLFGTELSYKEYTDENRKTVGSSALFQRTIPAKSTLFLELSASEAVPLALGAYDSSLACIFSEKGVKALETGEIAPFARLIFAPDCIFTEKHLLSFPCSLEFRGGELPPASLTVKTDESALLSLSLPRDYRTALPVLYDAPHCALTVEHCPLSLAELGLSNRLANVNGEEFSPYMVGGEGQALLEALSLDRTENFCLPESVSFRKSPENEFLLMAEIRCVTTENTLKNALLSLSSNAAGAYFEGEVHEDGRVNLLSEKGLYLVLLDAEGKSLRYLLKVDYIPTNLPVFVIETEGGLAVESKDEYINATLFADCSGSDGFESIPLSDIEIRGRGNSTWKWEKKPYKIKFKEKTAVLGKTPARQWVLLANYADKSLMRNTLAFSAAAFLGRMPFSPSQYPVDLFINGEYVGVYSIGEQIEVKEGRVEIEAGGDSADTGYLLEVGGTDADDVYGKTAFETELLRFVRIKSPDESLLADRKYAAFIKDYVKKADTAVKAGEGYENYIDTDSLIDWFILHELSYNLDSSFRRSCFLVKDAGGKLQMGPPWDFDLAFGNFFRDTWENQGWACLYEKDNYVGDNWMTYLLRNPSFLEKLRERWNEVGPALTEHLLEEIDRYAALIAPSAACNFKVWDILDKRAGYQPWGMVEYNTYELQVEFLKNYITKRSAWITSELNR